ncbi:hypothetical protein [Nocardioides sp. WS12]|uniref:hypothetical protein n=1 Tax=Nocardioides sp. WS12 TaxID=2486272 RepID=UPI0015F83C37|nr:hypothetical protein [Nocardioides sp. WS12]
MNWFTITLIVFAVLAVGVLALEVLRPRRSNKKFGTSQREVDQGDAFLRGGGDLDNHLGGGASGGGSF